jgi:beta-phosphoglucomutase family hydrolase
MRLGIPDHIRAVLFDLDGVITQTARVHAAAWKQMFDDFLRRRDGADFVPFSASDYDSYVDGKPRADGTRSFLESRGIHLPEGSPDDPPAAETVYGLGNRKNELLLRRIRDDGVDVYPTSVDYIRAARAVGLHTAVVSSSANTRDVLRSVGIEDLFDVRVDGTTIAEKHLKGKPAPDTFLLAADTLGVEPTDAAVFEDALAGVAAGRAGGFGYVVGVDRVGQADALRAHGADVVVKDVGELR